MLEVDPIVSRLRVAGCVFAEEEASALRAAAGDDAAALERLVERRVGGEPLELVIGWVEFAGLRVPTAPGVFVPRRRTELVAQLAIHALPETGLAVDLCCGSGAIAAAMATARPGAALFAADVDESAVRLARHVLVPLGATVVVSDMDRDLPPGLAGSVDVVTACPPYVPSDRIGTMAREARDYEPRRALDGGPDGTAVQARVFEAAARLLRPGGVCFVETSDRQAALTASAATIAGLSPTVEEDEDRGATVVVARRSNPGL